MLSTEPRQMSTIEHFSLGSIILWHFTPFWCPPSLMENSTRTKSLKKKWKKNSHHSRTCEIISWTYICRHNRFKETACSSSLQKHLIGNYESRRSISTNYMQWDQEGTFWLDFKRKMISVILFSIKKIKERKNVCWRKLGHISLRTWGRYFFLKCFPQDMHSCSFVRFPPWREPMWF